MSDLLKELARIEHTLQYLAREERMIREEVREVRVTLKRVLALLEAYPRTTAITVSPAR